MAETEVGRSPRSQAHEALLRRAIADVPIVVFAIDLDGTLTLLEGRGLEQIGVKPEELIGTSIFDLYGGMPHVTANTRRALAGERVRYRRALGGMTFDVQYTPVRDEAGDVTGVVGWRLDVTDRARAEEHTALLARAVDQTADAVLVTDTDGVVRYANAAFERLTGSAATELLDRKSALLDFERSNPELYHEIVEAMDKNGHWEGNLAGLRRDDTGFQARASLSLVRDASAREMGTVCVARDLNEVDRLQRRLERHQRTEAMGRLAGGIAHDFNNLLTAILGYAELCESEVDPDGLLAEGLAEIRQAAERGARLTGQMLAFNRSQPMRREPIALNELLQTLDGMLRRIIPENIDLRVHCGADAEHVLGDRGQIEQVALNLVVNAIDAMPTGGVLTLASARQASELEPADSSGFAVLSVADTGVGMTESQLEHIFEPFYTTKEVGEGTGLGLATVHGIVERCGGHVTVTSKPAIGTEFRVYLPKARRAPASSAREAPFQARLARDEKILYVEDDSRVRAAVERMLRSLGYPTFVAEDAEAALALMQMHQLSIDLLLTDVVMPGRSGIELAIDVRRLAPEARVLFVSGHASAAFQPQMLEEPGVGFLAKPFQMTTLDRALRELLDAPSTAPQS